MKNELDSTEKRIEEEALGYSKVSDLKKKKIESIIEKSSKKKVITLRLNENDLERIKSIAENEGIPYQTLISSILHKYINNRLVDKNEIFKVSEMINKDGWTWNLRKQYNFKRNNMSNGFNSSSEILLPTL